MKKRGMFLAAATAFMVGSALSACGSSDTKQDPVETDAAQTSSASQETSANGAGKNYCSTYDVANAGDVTLDVMITSLGDSDGGPYLRNVMDEYMSMYPNVKLNPVECSMNDLYTTLITQSTAGTLPDIFTMTEAYSANCLEMGMNVGNMAELLGEEYLNGLMDVAVENATVDGTLVYMPWQNNVTAMVYRKDLFEEKGIEIPKTWDEFRKAAKTLTEDLNGDGTPDRYGCTFAGTRNDSAESRFQTFALTYGCDFITPNQDGSFTSGFGTDAFRSAMASFVDMAANEGVTPPGFIETGYSEAYTMLAADKACMFFSASNVLGGIYNANPEMRGKMGSFPMPTAEGVDPVTSFSSVGMAISNTCKNPEVAADFLKFMTSVDNSVAWNEATCRLPVVKDALTAICEKDDAYSGFTEASDDAVIYPAFAGLAELRDACGKCWQSVVSEGVSVEDAVEAAASKAEEIAKSYGN
ncbi:ABC transporter substrate-binding protein [Clostridium sp. Marseille-P2415]|uniref:ABC transporter substrate-binding protein n=1 Tax=Clostridium sp. Marseille-P2415 TaxID=1805471 RepID=UPI000988655B|nr:extracellular solute-binding protein [Clostridium sp. Marseille-P2415]